MLCVPLIALAQDKKNDKDREEKKEEAKEKTEDKKDEAKDKADEAKDKAEDKVDDRDKVVDAPGTDSQPGPAAGSTTRSPVTDIVPGLAPCPSLHRLCIRLGVVSTKRCAPWACSTEFSVASSEAGWSPS